MYYYITPCVPCFCIIFSGKISYMCQSARATRICLFHTYTLHFILFFISCMHPWLWFRSKIYGSQIFGGLNFVYLNDLKYILPWDVIFKLWDIWVRKEMVIKTIEMYTSNVIRLISVINGVFTYWINKKFYMRWWLSNFRSFPENVFWSKSISIWIWLVHVAFRKKNCKKNWKNSIDPSNCQCILIVDVL